MSEQLALIRTKLRHLGRMAEYLAYEEDVVRLRELFDLLQAGTSVLLGYYESLRQFCFDSYGPS